MQRNRRNWINLLIQIVLFGGMIFCINMQFFGRRQMAVEAFLVSAFTTALVVISYGLRRYTQRLFLFVGFQITLGGIAILGGFMLLENLLQSERTQALWGIMVSVLFYIIWSFAVKLNENSLKSYEYLSWKYGLLLIAAYIAGKIHKNDIWIQTEMVAFLCFVLLQIMD